MPPPRSPVNLLERNLPLSPKVSSLQNCASRLSITTCRRSSNSTNARQIWQSMVIDLSQSQKMVWSSLMRLCRLTQNHQPTGTRRGFSLPRDWGSIRRPLTVSNELWSWNRTQSSSSRTSGTPSSTSSRQGAVSGCSWFWQQAASGCSLHSLYFSQGD